MQKPPRIWVSNANPKKGEVLRVRAQMEHTMESGLRTDPATGKLRPRNIVTHFEAKLGNALLFSWEPGISVSQNPYIEFTFAALRSGQLRMIWTDDSGEVAAATQDIELAG